MKTKPPFLFSAALIAMFALVWGALYLSGTFGNVGGRLLGVPLTAVLIMCVLLVYRSRKCLASLAVSLVPWVCIISVLGWAPEPMLLGLANEARRSINQKEFASYINDLRSVDSEVTRTQMSGEAYERVFLESSRLGVPQIEKRILGPSSQEVALVWSKVRRLGAFFIVASDSDEDCMGIVVFEGACAGFWR